MSITLFQIINGLLLSLLAFVTISGVLCVRACVHPSIHPSGFVQTITSTFMHEFQNNLAQLFSLRSSSAI